MFAVLIEAPLYIYLQNYPVASVQQAADMSYHVVTLLGYSFSEKLLDFSQSSFTVFS